MLEKLREPSKFSKKAVDASLSVCLLVSLSTTDTAAYTQDQGEPPSIIEKSGDIFLQDNSIYNYHFGSPPKKQSKNEMLHEILNENETRAVLVAALGVSMISVYQSHLHARKYEEKKLHALHVSAPILASASIAALTYDSYDVIDRHIPSAFFLGATVMQAGYIITNTYEHHRDERYRNTGIALGGALITLGTTTMILSHRMELN